MKSSIHGGKIENRFLYRVTIADVESSTRRGETTKIEDTGTSAEVGDVIRFEDGPYQYREFTVISVPDADHFVVAGRINPTNGNTFYVLRYTTQRVDSSGAQLVVLAPTSLVAKDLARVNAGSTSITTAAYVELIAATSAEIVDVEIINTTGRELILATGAAGLEANKIYIPDGGLKRQQISFPLGTRLSLKAVDATADYGSVVANLFG